MLHCHSLSVRSQETSPTTSALAVWPSGGHCGFDVELRNTSRWFSSRASSLMHCTVRMDGSRRCDKVFADTNRTLRNLMLPSIWRTRTMVLDVLSWSRLQLIHRATSSMHADIRSWSESLSQSRNRRSTCRPCTHVDEGCDVQSVAVSQLYTSERGSRTKDWPLLHISQERELILICYSGHSV